VPGGVRPDPGAQRPAHQAVRGDAEVLALEVPQRAVDPRERLDGQALLAVVAERGVQPLPDRLGRERIHTDQERLHRLDLDSSADLTPVQPSEQETPV
jgi:uncharacterized protein involved in type VI secretion and phage assembly